MTADTLTITSFLRDRINEDEAVARASLASNETLRVPVSWIEGVAARVLVECKAKRAILETATELAAHDDLGSSTRDDGEAILRALAAVYADHAAYNPEWA